MQLSRLLITGPLTETTPICVIEEIIDCDGIVPNASNINQFLNNDELLRMINNHIPPSITKPYTQRDYELLARFINPDVPWTYSKLEQAYDFLQQFYILNDITHNTCSLIRNAHYGLQTPENPLSLNACMLYRICLKHNIELTRRTSFSELSQLASLVHQDLNTLRNYLLSFIPTASSSVLLKLFLSLTSSHPSLFNMIQSLNDPLNQSIVYQTPTIFHNIESENVPMNDNREFPDTNENIEMNDDPELEQRNIEVGEEFEQRNVEVGAELEQRNSELRGEREQRDVEIRGEREERDEQIRGEREQRDEEIDETDETESETNSETSSSEEEEMRRTIDIGDDRYQEMIEIYHNLSDINIIRRRIEVGTEIEAVILGALNYKIDISDAQDPIKEYRHLRETSMEGGIYIPKDTKLMETYKRDQYGLRLDITFNPRLPRVIYAPEDLKALAISEGYLESDFRFADAYELLQTSYIMNNFYHGKLPELTNRTTPIYLEKIKSIDNNVMLSYGVKGMGMIGIRYGELAKTFMSSLTFKSPFDINEVIDLRLIRKLKNLCQLNRVVDNNEEAMDERRELFEAISKVELFISEKGEKALELFEIYKYSSNEIRHQIELCINKLLELSMNLRGWLGIGDYPIANAPVDDQEQVDIKVTVNLSKFYQQCDELGTIGQLILSLPLLEYRGGQFIASSDENNGLTIGDKLEILKRGHEADAIYSCIRISSNWLAATVYRYMQILGLPEPFNITLLRRIT